MRTKQHGAYHDVRAHPGRRRRARRARRARRRRRRVDADDEHDDTDVHADADDEHDVSGATSTDEHAAAGDDARRGRRDRQLRGPKDVKRSLIISLVVTLRSPSRCVAATLGAGRPRTGPRPRRVAPRSFYKPAHPSERRDEHHGGHHPYTGSTAPGVGGNVDSQGGDVVVQFPGVRTPRLSSGSSADGPALPPDVLCGAGLRPHLSRASPRPRARRPRAGSTPRRRPTST